MELQKAAKNNIKLITLAPELEGQIPLIKNCVKNGLVASLGHHNGTATDIKCECWGKNGNTFGERQSQPDQSSPQPYMAAII